MRPTQKDGCLARNPVESPTPRVLVRDRHLHEWATFCDSISRFGWEKESFAFSFGVGVLILLQDQPCCPQSSGAFRRLCYNVLVSDDLLGFIETCSAFRAELVQCGSAELALSKAPKSRWARGLSSAIRHALDVSLCVHPCVEFDRLTTFLGWLKRLPVRIRPCEQSQAEYVQADKDLSSIDFDESVYVPMLREVWVEWLKDYKLSDQYLPKHGSGSTADVGRVAAHKWAALQIDRVAAVCLRLPNLRNWVELPIGQPSRQARVKFVPKQAGKDRTICMEPAWLQYLQQGIAKSIVAYTRQHPQLSQYVDFRDQTRNQRLCAQAYTEGYATMDLSNASDSVSWRLIKRLCHGMPLARYLYGTRSSSVSLAGTTYFMDKYAPMGSALCFPIETILFASVVEVAYRIRYGQASRGYHSGCSVYGDDIICPSEIYGLVEAILHDVGFTVNASKSFSSGGYYESCGVEYLYGVRINAMRHPRKHLLCQQELSPEQVGTIVDLSNNLAAYGCFDARRFLLKFASKKKVRVAQRSKAFFDVVRVGAGGLLPVTDPYQQRIWDKDLQRSYVPYLSIDTQPQRTRWDIMHAKCMSPRRSREQRLHDLRRPPALPEIPDNVSTKAVLCLCRMGHFSILQDIRVESVGTPGTGRLREKVSRHRDYSS